ncbi:hypothetical protein JW916_05290 [Candidatus Sumerlaeota bacterium]|nr:hypothetical protein [Candidatus Sumerlaeota bacterium]
MKTTRTVWCILALVSLPFAARASTIVNPAGARLGDVTHSSDSFGTSVNPAGATARFAGASDRGLEASNSIGVIVYVGFLPPVPTDEGRVEISEISDPEYGMGILRVGARVYMDRNYVFAAPIPADLEGWQYILTRNNDKLTTTGLSFQIDRPAVVVVAFDRRIFPRPEWLDEWIQLAELIHTTDSYPDRLLFRRDFDAGIVEIGPNVSTEPQQVNGLSMYTVIVGNQLLSARNEVWMLYR